ncbi:MAG TPA: hypothetical protein VGR00_10825 [Thermoanaerobaculia bacterium]|jgi:hypothetical protein|nr:hypothetical protein [Thermoanaerobaculia bacterium]
MATVEHRIGCRNLLSRHREEDYPGLMTYRPPGWDRFFIVPELGQGFVAKGGEEAYAISAPNGFEGEEIRLRAGERATLVELVGDAHLGRWRIERD